MFHVVQSNAGHPLESGCLISMVVDALIVSCWGGAKLYDYNLVTLCKHSFFAYYFLLMGATQSLSEHKKKWSRHFLPKTTLKNLLYTCARTILGCIHWDERVPFRPCSRTETCCETHFSAVKAPFRGQPSIKDAILGSYHCHMKQHLEARKMCWDKASKGVTVTPLSVSEVESIAEECFGKAAAFLSWISVDQARLEHPNPTKDSP